MRKYWRGTQVGREPEVPLDERRDLKTPGALPFWLLCSALILLGATSIPESQPQLVKNTPTQAMKATVTQAMGVLQDEQLKKPEHVNERVNRLKDIAYFRFDYGEMAKRSLGAQSAKLVDREFVFFDAASTE